MNARLFLLKLIATLAALICGGCLPQVSVTPLPQPNVKPLELKITIDGEGKINVGGGAEITAKAAKSEPERCPCCGSTGACEGRCGKPGCVCTRGTGGTQPVKSLAVASTPEIEERPPAVFLYSMDYCSGCEQWRSALAAIADKPFKVIVLKSAPPWERGNYTVPLLHWNDIRGQGRMIRWNEWQGAEQFVETWRRSMR